MMEPAGLSTAHNSTLSSALIWAGGSKIKVTRNYVSGSQVGGGRRGVIVGFSQASRRRMMRKLAETAVDKLPVFVTMTFPDEYYDNRLNWKHWKKILRRFEMRFIRAFPKACYLWRVEWKPRLSGKHIGDLFPHFHLLVWGLDMLLLRSWVARNWWEVAGKLSEDHFKAGTRTEPIYNRRQMFAYISKYMSKVTPEEENIPCGRVWGVVAVENIPWVKGLLIQLTEQEAIKLIRYLRRYAHLKSRDYKSLTVLVDGNFWYDRLQDILYS